jgi:hypothetical protein
MKIHETLIQKNGIIRCSLYTTANDTSFLFSYLKRIFKKND